MLLPPSTLLQELFPGNYLPTPTHYFMRLLHDKGLLLRCYTQVGQGRGGQHHRVGGRASGRRDRQGDTRATRGGVLLLGCVRYINIVR